VGGWHCLTCSRPERTQPTQPNPKHQPTTHHKPKPHPQIPYAWGAGLLDADTHQFVRSACNGSYWNATRNSKCWDALDLVEGSIGDVNPYDVGSACFFQKPAPDGAARTAVAAGEAAGERLPGPAGGAAGAASRRLRASSGSDQRRPQVEGGRQRLWPFAARFEKDEPVGNWWSALSSRSGSSPSSSANGLLRHTVPCADRRAALAYYNDAEVRRAIHAAPSKVAGRWVWGL